MKLSVSLPEDDVALLDDVAAELGLESRSASLQRAVRLLRESRLEVAYAAAIEEWAEQPEASRWEATAGDGLT